MHEEGGRRLESRMSSRTEVFEPRSEQPSDSIGADDEDIAIMSNSLQISDQEQSITLDDDDFESIDLLVRRAMRKPARGHNRHHGHHVPAASRRRVMSTGGLLALCFFCVCSGPLNPSEVIADDPVTGTLFLVLFPLLCSGPYAAIIAELASALPEDGGYVVWALNAFGPACALQVGFWAWAASIFARVYRITLAFNLVTSALGVSVASGVTFFAKAVIAIVLTLPSLLGTKALTWTLSFALLVCVVAPYAVLTGWGYSQERITSASSVKTSSGEGIDWVGLGSTVFWSFDGFHVASTAGGHVLNPARTFPHAIYFTFLTVYMLYLLPLLASFSATRDQWRQLSDWSFPSLAEQIGGTGLRSLIIAASAIGLLGMYTAQVFCEGYQLTGMADISLAPKFLRARTKRFDSPHWSIIASLVAVLAVSTCSLEYLLPVANTFAALTQLVVLAAALELRRSLPYMPRPAKVPGGIPLMLLLSLLPALLLGYLIVKTFMETETAIICGSLLALGVILGVARAFRSRRRYL